MIFRRCDWKSGFTLLEVLCVIGIIGILASILIPSINMARRTSLKAKSKAQFHQYIFALEAYYHEYGRYPYFFYERPLINLKDCGEEFIKALSGRGGYPEYEELSDDEVDKLNSKRISFYHFGESEFEAKGKLKDGFDNPNIYVSIDTEGKGFQRIREKMVATRIAIYTQKLDGEDYEDVQSWK